MSAKDAPGEVKNNNIFGSPNISSASDDEEIFVDEAAKKAEEERRKRETVDIDGVPIDEKDIKFKSDDIHKKSKMNYFVNVEGEEERKKAEARKKEEERRAAEKKAAEEKQAAERRIKEAERAAEEKQASEKKHIEEVESYVKQQKAKAARAKKQEQNSERREKLYNLFWKGKRKFFTIGVPILLGLIIFAVIFWGIIPAIEEGEYSEELAKEAEMIKERENRPFDKTVREFNNDEILDNAFINSNYAEIDEIYAQKIETMTDDTDIAKLYIDKADRIMRYHPEEIERIIHEAEMAYSYDPNEPIVVNALRGYYNYAGQYEKADEMAEKLEMIYKTRAAENPDSGEENENEILGTDYVVE
jgi:hypothetical protein